MSDTTDNKPHIGIALCTANRHKLLDKCLESLVKQSYNNIDLSIIIVENNPEPSIKDLLKKHKKALKNNGSETKLLYTHEPKQGIPIARNAAIKRALRIKCDWLAFIDDDEIAPANWITAHYLCTKKYEADVIHGPVTEIVPAPEPFWYVKKNKKHKINGTIIKSAATNNTLVNISIFTEKFNKLRFSEDMRLTGGSDTEFFLRATDNGAKIVWDNTTLLYEHITPERLTFLWQCKRAMRVSSNETHIHIQRKGYWKGIIKYLPKNTFRVIKGVLMITISPLLYLPDNKNFKYAACNGGKNISSFIGYLRCLFCCLPQPYKKSTGI